MKLSIDTKIIEPVLSVLNDADAGSLFKSILNHVLGKECNPSVIAKPVFDAIKDNINTCQRKSEIYRDNISKRWTREEKDDEEKKEEPIIEQQVIVVEDAVPTKPKRETKPFVKPTKDEVIEYFINKLHEPNNIQAALFYDYYESNGWRVGKFVMKSWHSAASGWSLRNRTMYGTNRQHTADKFEQQSANLAAGCARRIAEENARKDIAVPPILREQSNIH